MEGARRVTGQLSGSLFVLQCGQGDLGLELCTVLSALLAHIRSSFKGLIQSLPRCPNFGDHRQHLAKKYRKEAHRRFITGLDHNSYDDARQMLLGIEK